MEIYKDIEQLLEKNLKLYENGCPIMKDEDYDRLKRYLSEVNPDSYFLDKIGNKPKINKETLPYILGSIKNKSVDNIFDWYNPNTVYVLSHKLDGIAVLCEFNGTLKNAWLRGDHYIGENITSKARKFIKNNGVKNCFVKGEIVLTCDPVELGYKNKRNAVAGIINRDDGKNLDKLTVIYHGVAYPEFDDEITRLNFIEYNELPVVEYITYAGKEIVKRCEDFIQYETFYDKDGIVITRNGSLYENVKYPEAKIALKFNEQKAITEVIDVEWNTSRTGKIVPIVHINPVELGGATINKCTGFNAKFILDNCIGKDTVITMCRAGDVIPHIDNVIEKTKNTIRVPDKCPTCNNELKWDGNKVNLECDNLTCSAQVQKRLVYFLRKLGLENFDESKINKLNCFSITDIFNYRHSDLIGIEGWAEKTIFDFIGRINELKKTTHVKFLASLGIKHLGETTSKLILDNGIRFEDLLIYKFKEDYLPDYYDELYQELVDIKGISYIKANEIVNGLFDNKDLIRDLIENIGFTFNDDSENKLNGLAFALTGALSVKRKEFVNIIMMNGGIFTETISKCNYLVTNNSDSNSSKMKKAIKDGVIIINEEQFYKMIDKKVEPSVEEVKIEQEFWK